MAAHETRLLMLGAVKLFEPVNGYQIRRELVSWSVEEWANLRPGSIYSGLNTLTKQGMLARHEVPDGSRSIAVYTLTGAGNAEFGRLYAEAVRTVDQPSAQAFHTALALVPLVPRAEFEALLRVRVEALAQRRAAAAAKREAVGFGHVRALVDLWTAQAEVEERWCRELLDRVAAGELYFAGEPRDWSPPSNDPGWEIHRDREHYLRVLNLG